MANKLKPFGTVTSVWNTRLAAPVECHPRDTNSVEYHETRNVADKTVEALETVVLSNHGELVTRSQAEAIIAAKDAEIAELKKDLADREWISNKHNERRAKYKADNAALTAKLETANALVTCCCGNPIDNHGTGDGHSPVDQYHYAMSKLQEENAALTARVKDLEKDVAKREEHRGKLMKGYRGLETQLAAVRKALEPFAKAADGRRSKGVMGSTCFAQHHLFAARAALEAKP